MSQKLPNDYEEHDSGGEKGSSQKILLLVLLLLVAVFAYLYFFTSLIRPQVAVVAPPVTQVAQVKQPIPPRAGQPANKSGEPVSPEAAKTVPPPGEKPGTSAAPAVPSKPMPAPPVTARPPNSPAPAVPAKTATPVKPAAPVPAKADQAKPAAPVPAKAEQAKPVVRAGEQPTAAVKPVEKKRAAAGSARKLPKSVGKKTKTVYAFKINADLAASEVQPMLARLKNVGLTAIVLNKVNREECMHRLFQASFDRQNAAQAEAQKLKALAPASFILFENDKYSVYAGSYLREDKAIRERDRLFDKGVKLTVNSAQVAVPVINITAAGHFADRNEADNALKRLHKSGVSATVVKTGSQEPVGVK